MNTASTLNQTRTLHERRVIDIEQADSPASRRMRNPGGPRGGNKTIISLFDLRGRPLNWLTHHRSRWRWTESIGPSRRPAHAEHLLAAVLELPTWFSRDRREKL